MGRGSGVETDSGGQAEEGEVCTNTQNHANARKRLPFLVRKMLNFKVQQVAVDLVVDIRIILLLAQVQAWDVHRRLETKRVQAVSV